MRSALKKFFIYAASFLHWWRETYCRLNGVQNGRNTMISLGAKIDSHAGKVNIGDNCHITYGSVILSHDGAAKNMCADDDGAGAVIIGNKLFVGVNAVILRNVRIGDNRVIGTGAVVTADIPANSLVVGNPAKVVRSINTPADPFDQVEHK